MFRRPSKKAGVSKENLHQHNANLFHNHFHKQQNAGRPHWIQDCGTDINVGKKKTWGFHSTPVFEHKKHKKNRRGKLLAGFPCDCQNRVQKVRRNSLSIDKIFLYLPESLNGGSSTSVFKKDGFPPDFLPHSP